MKIYKTYLYAFGILAGGLLNASCVDMLTEDPNSYYEKKDIFATKAKTDIRQKPPGYRPL